MRSITGVLAATLLLVSTIQPARADGDRQDVIAYLKTLASTPAAP